MHRPLVPGELSAPEAGCHGPAARPLALEAPAPGAASTTPTAPTKRPDGAEWTVATPARVLPKVARSDSCGGMSLPALGVPPACPAGPTQATILGRASRPWRRTP